MRLLLTHVLLLAVCLFSGCATPYQKNTGFGGYSEFRVAEDRFVISFQGNSYSSHEEVYKYAMLRAAALALKHGYPYFSIHQERDISKTSIGQTGIYVVSSYSLYSSPAIMMVVKLHKTPSEYEDLIDAVRYTEWNHGKNAN
jgi:hypothetical protein